MKAHGSCVEGGLWRRRDLVLGARCISGDAWVTSFCRGMVRFAHLAGKIIRIWPVFVWRNGLLICGLWVRFPPGSPRLKPNLITRFGREDNRGWIKREFLFSKPLPSLHRLWIFSGRLDSNQRPSGPEPSALATPRHLTVNRSVVSGHPIPRSRTEAPFLELHRNHITSADSIRPA